MRWIIEQRADVPDCEYFYSTERAKRMPVKTYILFFFFSSLAAAQENPLASIEGTVVHAVTKEPVRKAQVILELGHVEHSSALVAITGDAGLFRFADIKEGSYKLTVEKPGFLDGSFGASKAGDPGTLLKVAQGDRQQGLILLLAPGGTISGRVLDSEGDPIPGSEVTLWKRKRAFGQSGSLRMSRVRSDRSGDYSFAGLASGSYYIGASTDTVSFAVRRQPVDDSGKTTRIRDLTTYYPAALSLTDAQAVPIESGREQSAVDIRIQRGASVSLKGKIAGMSSVPSSYHLWAQGETGSSEGEFLPRGEFLFKELLPGKYRLTLSTQGPDSFERIGETEVNVSTEDVTGVVVTPFKPAVVRVRVVMEAEPGKALTYGPVFLHSVEESAEESSSISQWQSKDGEYVFQDIVPGTYWIWFDAGGSYLKSIQAGGQALDPEAIEVRDGAVDDLLLTFSRNGASLTGDVELPQDQADHSAHVVLVPEKPSKIPVLRFKWPELDQTLHFQQDHLRPGKYLAFATEEVDRDLWSQPGFIELLEDKAAALDLHDKEQATTHLKLITKDETDRARKQLGL